MWIAFGHQSPHANVQPSSFVEPNVPFRMCHEMSASQFPVVGSASKLHGHPHAQLQLCMYSASKLHFVGIDLNHLSQVRISSRLLKTITVSFTVGYVHVGRTVVTSYHLTIICPT